VVAHRPIGESAARAWAHARQWEWGSWALCLGTGAMAGLGRPGIGVFPLYWLGLVMLGVHALRARSWGSTVAGSILWGVGLFAVSSTGTLTWGVRVALTIIAVQAIFYSIPFAVMTRWLGRRLPAGGLIVVFTAGWSLLMARPDLLGSGFHGTSETLAVAAPWALAGARLFGANAVTAVTTALCALWAQAWTHRWKHAALPTLLAVVWLGGTGVVAWLTAEPPTRTIRVGVPQMNVEEDYYLLRLLEPERAIEFETRLDQQLTDLADAELIVMPESLDGGFGLSMPPVQLRWARYAREHRQAILYTSYMVEPGGRKSNAIGAFSANGELTGIHKKVAPAPFGERGLVAGTRLRTLAALPDAPIGAFICQESYGPAIARRLSRQGAQLFAASSSDVTFGSTVTPFEHLAATQLRAIENGRSIVWASNAGPSGVMDRWGSFRHQGPFRRAAAIRLPDVALHNDLTLYTTVPWLWPLLSFMVLAAAAYGYRFEPRQSEMGADQHGWRTSAWLGSISVLATAAVWFTSPVIVGLLHGQDQPWANLRELRGIVESSRPEANLGRFAATKTQSSVGAMSYWLSYYGMAAEVRDFHRTPPPDASLEEVASFVERELHVPVARGSLELETLPSVPALVQMRDGSLAVLFREFEDAPATLFSPTIGASFAFMPTDLSHLVGPSYIVPRPLSVD
jgi:apolipoprotein N-acyltransferase